MTKIDLSFRPSANNAAFSATGFANSMPALDRGAASQVEALLPIIRKSAESFAARHNHVLPPANGDTLA